MKDDLGERMKNEVINDYIFNFLSNKELSAKYNLHRTIIQRILMKENITLRKRTPLTKVSHFFFSIFSKENCYWAGFLLADGYIRTNKRFTVEIKLQKEDYHHLEKFKSSLQFDGKIIEKENYFSISISSSQLVNDLLNNFDIKNKKSLTCHISNKIPEIFLLDFIRGYFDGDGCITRTSIDTINILGTYNTILFIREYFFNYCRIKLRSKDKPNIIKLKNIYQINYSGVSAFKCISILYENCDLYLDRKYDLYLKLKEKYENKNLIPDNAS